MPEFRKDPILGRWIIIATERGQRPTDFSIVPLPAKGGFCPLCPGNERTTPPEVLSYGRPVGAPANSAGWTLRVVPNKYPALVIEGELDKEGEGLYDKMNGIGAHEVVVESPNHDDSFATMSPSQVRAILSAYRDRIVDLARDLRFQYVLVFKNSGKDAGASLEHSHSQLIALPILPQRVVSELEGCKSYFNYKERCVFCDIVRQETKQKERVVCENELFICLTPFAPISPFEMWILPRRHSSRFTDIDDIWLSSLAAIFSESLQRLDACIPSVPYNFVLHTAPLREREIEYYHWHFEIRPKLTSIAGFEWGSGFYINPMPPEASAEYLRRAFDTKDGVHPVQV